MNGDWGRSRAIIGIVLLCSFMAGSSTGSGLSGTVEVTADSLSVNNHTRKGVFRGQVNASFSGMRFRCDVMTITYSQQGILQSLVATGNVFIYKENVEVRAGKAQLDRPSGTLVLTGMPILIKGDNRLEGDTISVDLHSGDVRIEKARGVFRLGQVK